MSGHTPGLSLPTTIARILVTGFMGAGKTTVGGLLAGQLGWDFADSDVLVEKNAGMTVASLFATQGEAAFRDREAAAIRELVAGSRRVIALGGGALERQETRDLLASLPDTLLVFLDAPLETLVSRCSRQSGAAVRPVLADRVRLQQRFSARLPWYRQAHLTVDTADASPAAVAERICEQVKDRCHGAAPSRFDPDSAPAAPRTGVSA